MDESHDKTDSDLKQLLAGWRPDEKDFAALLSFLKAFDRAYPTPSVDHLEAAHLAAILAAARDMSVRE